MVRGRPLLVSGTGVLLVVIVGTYWLVALLLRLLCFPARFSLTGGLLIILLLGLSLTAVDGLVRLRSLCQRTPLWPASWLLAVDKSRGSKSVEVQRVWEVYDERLQFMSRQDALLLDESLDAGDVSRAWLVWSGAAETALADAYQFSGGSCLPLLLRSLSVFLLWSCG